MTFNLTKILNFYRFFLNVPFFLKQIKHCVENYQLFIKNTMFYKYLIF